MTPQNYITAYCSIKSSSVFINSVKDFSSAGTNAGDFLRAAYKHYQITYPKFYKMDDLCKLAFITSELLLKANNPAKAYKKEDIAIIIANSASSLQTDTDHQNTIKDKNNYFPSPSTFVYTLPNILIGEIAIRNTISGENTFFIFNNFDVVFMSTYINSLLDRNRAQCCITGWVDLYNEKYEAFLYTVEKQPGAFNIEHSPANLKSLLK